MPKETFEKIKNFVRSKLGEAIVLAVMAGLSILFTLIAYSVRLTPYNVNASGLRASLWNVKTIVGSHYMLHGAGTYFTLAFFVALALAIVGAVLSFLKRNRILYCVYAAFSFLLDIILLIFHFIFAMLQGAAIAFILLNMILTAIMFALLLAWRRRDNAERALSDELSAEDSDESSDTVVTPAQVNTWRKVMLACECVATVAMFSMLVVPIYQAPQLSSLYMYCLIQSLGTPELPIYFHIAFLVIFVGCIAGLLNFIATLPYVKTKKFYYKSKGYVYGVTFSTLAFFVAGYILNFITKLSQTESFGTSGAAISGIPFAIALVALLLHSVATGKCVGDIERGGTAKPVSLKIEPLIYVILMTVALFSTLLLTVVSVKATFGTWDVRSANLTGYQLLTDYEKLEGGFQLIAFLLYAMLLTSSVMLLMSIFSLVSKNKDYYTIVKTSAFTNLAFAIIIGLFGVYFRVAQQINEENIRSLLELFGLSGTLDYTYEMTSQTMIVLAACGLIFAIMLFRKQFNLAVDLKEMEVTLKNPKDGLSQTAATSAQSQAGNAFDAVDDASPFNFDACPAFTELDGKLPQINAELEAKRQHLFENFTLPNLVRFVVDYARECRLHLSYSLEDMATFVAGLGASRLSILQGMSGTGKTSLPKIFTEAVMGVCEIVEVESSWRDKNELLGYYNEFSKCFTPKKFTQCLYKARLNSSVLTLIVLDEMNLSRIEYYFSDFLSLMEHEPDKREIKLLNVKLCRTEQGKQIPYKGLTDGHTIKMPQNVWFIGTANRDESTFAISDKVYDRAQTMNFNKRAPKIHSFSEPLEQKFASYDMFISLFEEAKTSISFDAEEYPTVQKVEKILAPYNISFGNRILKQMEDFVKIYCACFGDKNAVLKEAVEKILLSKVVSKLENKVVENKEALAAEFDRLGLAACSDFVRKLNED